MFKGVWWDLIKDNKLVANLREKTLNQMLSVFLPLNGSLSRSKIGIGLLAKVKTHVHHICVWITKALFHIVRHDKLWFIGQSQGHLFIDLDYEAFSLSMSHA